jgi:hypothetical protein
MDTKREMFDQILSFGIISADMYLEHIQSCETCVYDEKAEEIDVNAELCDEGMILATIAVYVNSYTIKYM